MQGIRIVTNPNYCAMSKVDDMLLLVSSLFEPVTKICIYWSAHKLTHMNKQETLQGPKGYFRTKSIFALII